jgi:hypothetical protein
MTVIRSLQAAGLTAILATSSAAQVTASNAQDVGGSPRDSRSAVSIALIQTRPQGMLGRNIGLGYGASGVYLLRLDGMWSLRADVAAAAYGYVSRRSPLSDAFGGRVQVNTRTTNYIVPLSVGPQLSLQAGPTRPYLNAGVGVQGFLTESSVEGGNDHTVIASSTNQSDAALLWVAGGGIYVPIVPGMRRAQLDVSMQYLHGGHARYLAPGGIVDGGNGGVRLTSLESTTHLVMLRVGARIGL